MYVISVNTMRERERRREKKRNKEKNRKRKKRALLQESRVSAFKNVRFTSGCPL